MKHFYVLLLMCSSAIGAQIWTETKVATLDNALGLRYLSLSFTNAYCTKNQLWYYQKAWAAGMADADADSVTGDANLLGFDFHYQVDSLGSETP